MRSPPSPTGPNGTSGGRNPDGRFAPGNRAGRGNPHARRVARLRAALMRAVTPQDLAAVALALLAKAKDGDVAAARELLQRLLGPPVELDFVERLAAMERQLAELQERGGVGGSAQR